MVNRQHDKLDNIIITNQHSNNKPTSKIPTSTCRLVDVAPGSFVLVLSQTTQLNIILPTN
jgi:hypothetical protein